MKETWKYLEEDGQDGAEKTLERQAVGGQETGTPLHFASSGLLDYFPPPGGKSWLCISGRIPLVYGRVSCRYPTKPRGTVYMERLSSGRAA
ncbi:hypothetical protein E2C01_058942 [Portunus trituberculatus]|uniref:Uncharacterized protein n=1 Tax=Portunus trituberculatus TaxID=210409 RepID=A0A5B7H171_PORTR|nr:hypothetical protein [Portunus trituberculatus]